MNESDLVFCPSADLETFKASGWDLDPAWNDLAGYQIDSKLYTCAKGFDDKNNLALGDSIRVLAHVARLPHDEDNYENPYHQAKYLDDLRSAIPTDLKQKHIDLLGFVLDNSKNVFIKSRIADVFWVLNRKTEDALKAIALYLQRASDLADKNELVLEVEAALKRAIQLWMMLGKKHQFKSEIQSLLDRLTDHTSSEPKDFSRLFFVEMKSNFILFADAKEWIANCRMMSNSALNQKHFDKARKYLDCAITVSKIEKLKDIHKELLTEQTDLYETEAREMRAAGASTMITQHLYMIAIEANNQANSILANRKKNIEQLHKELNEVSANIKDDMKEVPHSQDITPLINSIKSEVASTDDDHALILIGQYARPRSWSGYKKSAEEAIKAFPLQSLFGSILVDDKGRVIARNAGMSATDESTKMGVIFEKAFFTMKIQMQISGVSINHARALFRERNEISIRNFQKILECNPFIPKNRIELISEALWAGFNQDWLKCTSVLVPQIENCLRHFLENLGHLVTRIDEDLTQDERDLNSLIYRQEVVSLLGDDLTYTMRGLLTERYGFNYRNRLAHGLCSSDEFSKSHYLPPYTWGFFIYLCVTLRSFYFKQLSRD